MANGPFVLTKFDILATITQESPRTAELLIEYGLHCVNCFANEMDTLEVGAQVHGMTPQEIDEMVEEINQQLEKEWREEHKK